MCEEFGDILPSEALRELDRVPVGFVEDVMEARAYARAKAVYESATTATAVAALPSSPLITLVREIEFALVQEANQQTNG